MSPEVMTYILGGVVALGSAILSLLGKFILDAIKSHLDATKANTLALALLDKEIKNVIQNSEKIPKLQEDLRNYFDRLRELERRSGVKKDYDLK